MQRDRYNKDLLSYFTPHLPTTASAEPGKSRSWLFNPGILYGGLRLSSSAITCCFPGCELLRSWNQEQSKDLNPHTLIQDADKS